MWTIAKEFRFEAAHRLPHHDGKCSRMHGHSWVMRVAVSGLKLEADGPKRDMVLDYADIKAAVAPLLDKYLDHYYLNDSLGMTSPTSERIARWVYDRLILELPGLESVTIEETRTSRCVYHP
jgi:6-pyruvoyltetrahydropterin/6-carboxytetrahydropterin synthase